MTENPKADPARALDFARTHLSRHGMSAREIDSTIECMTPEIKRALPGDAIADAREGKLPSAGFGLSGGAGIGKTGALCALMVTTVAIRVRVRQQGVETPASPTFEFVPWPETVNRIRVMASGGGGVGNVQQFLEPFVEASMLVLDDLGGERLPGTYGDDWAASQLDLVVDIRHRDGRPTHYTTALDELTLMRRYGQRLFSRLCGPNPLICVSAREDRRAVKEFA